MVFGLSSFVWFCKGFGSAAPHLAEARLPEAFCLFRASAGRSGRCLTLFRRVRAGFVVFDLIFSLQKKPSIHFLPLKFGLTIPHNRTFVKGKFRQKQLFCSVFGTPLFSAQNRLPAVQLASPERGLGCVAGACAGDGGLWCGDPFSLTRGRGMRIATPVTSVTGSQ